MNRTLSTIVGSFVLLCACVAHAAEIVIKPNEDAQAKINGYRSGDVVTFDGTRMVGRVFTIPNNGTLTVRSTPGTKLVATHHSFIFFLKGVKGVEFTANDLQGGGWYLQDCQFIAIHKNKVHNISGNGNNAQHGIFHLNLADSRIEDNDFWDIMGPGADTGVFGFGRKRSKVNFNRFHNVHEGIHDFFYDRVDSRGDNEVIGNRFTNTERHDIELQYCANGLKTQYNHISNRLGGDTNNGMGISNATGGVPGDPAGQSSSWNVDVSYNVIDFRGNTETDWSQNACVEAMRNIDVHHNWFIGNDTGKMQGILHSQNTAGWTSRFNQFQNISNWYSGGSGSPVIAPLKTGDKALEGAVPTYEQLVAMAKGQQPPPTTQPAPPPVNAPTLAVKPYRTMVHVTTTPGATIERRASQGGFTTVTLNSESFDTNFTADQSTNKWRWWYRATKDGVSSAEVEAQIGLVNDPAPLPPPPVPVPPVGELVMDGLFNGKPVKVIYELKNGVFNPQPTTRPAQPQQ